MEIMAKEFPNAFKGYTLTVKEAHQSSKVDTSGTAKAVVASFQGLGLNFKIDQIEKVRDRAGQLAMGVPGAPYGSAGVPAGSRARRLRLRGTRRRQL